MADQTQDSSISKELQEKLATAESQLKAKQAELDTKQAELNTLQTAHSALKTELDTQFKAQEEAVTELLKSNKELQEQLEAAKAATLTASGKLVVKNGKAEYEVGVSSFKWKNKSYQAQELATNKELLKQLVEAKAGFLKAL
ncbi:hypothetical protein QNI16_07235 [Cytophagaceae bacterium YF14B1]|uniref:Uncharacterized protein n=1 Tax=Xanthocytophaga flava TaxID=3048013 RepID=A0AAE3U676_9BACT|nr:hypothetical protein [Xanthocytophaga flavus]MDJ1480272.1 hypothetical protein [Xanthocytophaga flavus]